MYEKLKLTVKVTVRGLAAYGLRTAGHASLDTRRLSPPHAIPQVIIIIRIIAMTMFMVLSS